VGQQRLVAQLFRPRRAAGGALWPGAPASLPYGDHCRSWAALRLGARRSAAAGALQGPMKKLAIVQSNYIPWKGYFDLINSVDEFILYDVVQYTRRDWRNRNLIKTREGLHWLTIPVQVKGRYSQTIEETRINDQGWGRRHLEAIRHSYRRAPFFDQYEPLLTELYRECSSDLLSEVNERFLTTICRLLGIPTVIS